MRPDAVARKERWARRMPGRAPSPEGREEAGLPPGQSLRRDLPVLDLGFHPDIPLDRWRLQVGGLVERPLELDWEGLMELPQASLRADFHCVTSWSCRKLEWQGTPFAALADRAGPRPGARHVFFRGYDGYTTCNPLEACLRPDALLAHRLGGEPLALPHGAPLRVILPERYGWKGVKFVREILFVDRDVPGFWELRGYSSSGDPWKEERFDPALPASGGPG